VLQPLMPSGVPTLTPYKNSGIRALRPRAILALLLLHAVTACKGPLSGFGGGVRARIAVDQFYDALTNRYFDIQRNPKYEYARVQLAHGVFTPSRIFDDSSAWTAASGAVRILETFGTHVDDHYSMASMRGVPAPRRPGDGRHVSTLSKLSDSEYRWDTNVDFALGSIRSADLATVIGRLLAGGEGLTEHEARAELASVAPRTSAAFGTLFSLDTIRPVTLGDGSTLTTVGISVHSDQLRARLPALAEFVHKYVDPARLRFLLSDRSGNAFLEITGRDRFLSVRVRTLRGHLVTLAGPPRPMPDSLVLTSDFTTKMKMWHIGFHDLVMDFVNGSHEDGEHDWVMTARKEPQWNLPMITARLLRAPLRRPFTGEGALIRIGVRDGNGDRPTVLFRQTRLTVQESAILKFINSLTNSAMDDFGGRVEREENIWLRELFLAMRDDARAALPPQ
jgi:hypothetical protein